MPAITVMATWLLIFSAMAGLLALLLYSHEVVAYAYTSYFLAWLQSRWHPAAGGLPVRTGVTEPWNQLYHLGGNSPWIQKVDGVVNGSLDVPTGCRIDQVHMVGHERRCG